MNKFHKQLGTEKIGKLLFKQATPAMIGLLIISLYNLVDTIFIGRYVGSLGIAALAIAFPVQMIAMGLSQTLGVGASSIISRALGAKKYDVANKTLGNFFSLTAIVGISFTALGILFLNPLLRIFGSTSKILPFANDYLSIILYGTFLIIFAAAANNIIRAEGNAKYAMTVMIIGGITNIILDFVFIGYFGWGMKGAAWATVISHSFSALGALFFFTSKRTGLHIALENFKLKLKIVKEIISIGFSSFARIAAGSVMAIVLNHSLAFYGGEIAIAAIGIVHRVTAVVIMPLFGLVAGMQPVVGYNYGAKLFKRTKDAVILSIKSATVMSTIMFLALFLFAEAIIKLFTTDLELIELSVRATKIMIILLPIVGFQIVAAGMYQALGKAAKALFLSILRQVIILAPIILLLPLFLGLEGVFIAFPVSDLIAAVIIFFMLRKELFVLKHKEKI